MLSVLASPISASAAPDGRFAAGEIVVKLRQRADKADRTGPHFEAALETLRSHRYVRDIRPLLRDAAGLRASARRGAAEQRRRAAALRRRRSRHIEGGQGPGFRGVWRVRLGRNLETGEAELLAFLRRHPDVEYAELNPIISACLEPDDPQYAAQWGLAQIDAPDAWETCRGSGQVVVAIVDTGLDLDHRDLQGSVWFNEAEVRGVVGVDDDDNGYVDDTYGYNFAYNTSDPSDDHGHGTHCAGTIAAVGNNALDATGVCWSSRLMSLKVLGADGDGTAADAATAVYYAVANGADVISNSWGGSDESRVLKEAIAYAQRQGVIVVAAAGNESSNKPFYPAAYPGAVAVAATDKNDRRWSLSNYGDWVDIAAPGRDILSLRAAGTSQGTLVDAFTTRQSGTSMATPYISGACALLLSAVPFLSYDEIYEILVTTADPISEGIVASNGRLNVSAAMRAAVPTRGVIRFDRSAYAEGDILEILLADWSLRGEGTQEVTVETDGGDIETVTLQETPTAVGVFHALVPSEAGFARLGDDWLQVDAGQQILARYWDADDGSGRPGQWTEARAWADYEPPVILDLQVTPKKAVAWVTFATSEPAVATVQYGRQSGGPYPFEAEGGGLQDEHDVKLSGLVPETEYFFVVLLEDAAGNQTTAGNDGHDYSFTTSANAGGLRVPSVYATIQAAVDDAVDGDTIWVAPGTYSGPGNIALDFSGKAIMLRSETGPDDCIIDCQGEDRAFDFHSGETAEAVVDGFTITGGGKVDLGGGMRCTGSSPTILNCIFVGNRAKEWGGGLCNVYGSCPHVLSCVFKDNDAAKFGHIGSAGGMCNRYESHPTVENCTFVGNSAANSAGGMGNFSGSDPVVVDCDFKGNSARHRGGAVLNSDGSQPVFRRCLFSGNWAGNDGGGLCNQSSGPLSLENCIISDNLAEVFGGAIQNDGADVTMRFCTLGNNHAGWACGGIWNGSSSTTQVENCILWGNTDAASDPEQAQFAEEESSTAIGYSCVQGWTGLFGGVGNFGHDPLFVSPEHGEFHLRSSGWRWDDARQRWTYDRRTSPCIDTGHPGRPLGEEPLTVPDDPGGVLALNRRVNMGAYGGSAQASLARPDWSLRADVDNDGLVDWRDLSLAAIDWPARGGTARGDLTRDRVVDAADLAVLGAEWRHRVRPPAVEIVEPRDGSILARSVENPIVIRAEAWDADGRIAEVEFLADDKRIAVDEQELDGWRVEWEGYRAGAVTLHARATGEDGVRATSAAVKVTVVLSR
jgi:subtilisin family serine protease